MLLCRPESFAKRNFYGNLEIIFIKTNQQNLHLFEGLAHGEKLFCLRSTFKEVKCMFPLWGVVNKVLYCIVFKIKLFCMQGTTS